MIVKISIPKISIVLCFLIFYLFSSIVNGQSYLRVLTFEETLKPSYTESSDEREFIDSLFEAFEVTEFTEPYYFFHSDTSRHKYHVFIQGDTLKMDSLKNILIGSGYFLDVRRINPFYYEACDNPVAINDEHLDEGWLNNNALEQIDAQCAWTITLGDPEVHIAMVEADFDVNHEDLDNKETSIIGTHSSFHSSHGTTTAGILAGKTNNGIGIASIGNQIKYSGYIATLYNNQGEGDPSSAIVQAYQHGEKIINVSWSGCTIDRTEILEMTQSGVILVFSAGTTALPYGHSNYDDIPGVIIVSGVDPDGYHGRTTSQSRATVDLCAPSENISTTNFLFSTPTIHNLYGGFDGTSYAAPLVSGTIGLMLSVNKCLNSQDIEYILKSTTSPIVDASTYTGTAGTGILNAYNAVQKAVGENGATLTINTNTTISTDKNNQGDIIINPNQTLTITGDINFQSGKYIIVKPKGKLIVDGGRLYSGCTWGGIIVEGKSSDPQTSFYQGMVEFKNEAIIENAIVGVQAIGVFTSGPNIGKPNPWTTKGIITAKETTFKNNKTDVVIWGYTKTSLDQPIANISWFRDCKFITSNYSINDFKEHISLVFCNRVFISGCSFYDERTGESLNGRIGINTISSSYILTSYYNGISSKNNYFNKLKRAVQSVSVPSFDRIHINNTKTVMTYKGVFLSENPYARIVNNEFHVWDDSRGFGTPTEIPYCLYVDKTNAFDIEHNIFEGHGTGGEKNSGGLIIRNSGANANTFYSNNFSFFRIASQALNENNDGDRRVVGLQFRCNKYDDNVKDLHSLIEPDIIIVPPLSGMANEQGSFSLPADNTFDDQININIFNIENSINTSMRYYHQNEFDLGVDPITKPLLVSNVDLVNTSQDDYQCPDKLIKSGMGWPHVQRVGLEGMKVQMAGTNGAWKSLIDNGNTPDLMYDIENLNLGTAIVMYNQLMSFSPWLSLGVLGKVAVNTVLTDQQIRNILVANPHAGRSKWILYLIDERAIPMSPFLVEDILNISDSLTDRDTMAWEVSEVNTNYDLTLNDLVGWYLDDTVDRIATLDTLLKHPYSPSYRYQLAGIYFERGMYTTFQNILDSIPAQIDLSESEIVYHESFNNLYNQIKLWKLDSVPLPIIDSSQLVWLKDFATENPVMPGIGYALLAVNDSSYTIFDPVYITDTTQAGPEPIRAKTNSFNEIKASSLLNIYPIPTERMITIEWKNNANGLQKTHVTIFDEMGKLIFTQLWEANQNSLKIDLNALTSGIYYLQVSSNNTIFETHKIILTK